jgi:hypothetical protein
MYRSYGTDAVTVQNASYGILLDGKSYITVQGINFTNLDRFMYLQNGANNNVIAYCNFDGGRTNAWTGSMIQRNSKYNWIHHSRFSKYGACVSGYASGSDQGTTLDIGNEEDGSDASSFNLIEDSIFYHAGHHVMGVFSRYNTIRNNYLHNEAWSNGRGHRTLYLQGVESGSGYVLFEGNRFGYSTRSCNNANPTTHNVLMTTSHNIFRYNKIFHSVADGLGTYSYVSQGAHYSRGSQNRIYNNTVFNSGYGIEPSYKGGSEDAAIYFSHSVNVDNAVKNNLYSSNYSVHTGYTANQVFANNWNGDTQGDPKFVDANTTPPSDKMDSKLPNLDLRPGSAAIDKGGPLTTITSATDTGVSISVGDASYFQDGTYGPPGLVQADWIAVGSVDKAIQISSISGNTINLVNAISWTKGDPVWLYKKSDGARVVYGAAPDAGAYEFPGENTLPAPTNLRVSP